MNDTSISATGESRVTSAEFDFSHHVEIPADVLMREIGGEAVIVNLDSETYFGLDDVGTHMWTVLTESRSLQHAFESLINEYEVEEETLHGDFLEFLDKLVTHGLLVLRDAETI